MKSLYSLQIHYSVPKTTWPHRIFIWTLSALYRRRKRFVRHLRHPIRAIRTKFGAV